MFGHNFIGMHWIWWILIILAFVLIVFNIPGHESRSNTNESALEILDKRYAQGEIEREEYEERKNVLQNRR
ncbi:SHOCT domain-containing protein [Fodinibius sp.]|uniref:SHOCT domain-containing protein n=1 Tax=Fodinibius sp. TaxID=1872440 RepID=UPI003A10168F